MQLVALCIVKMREYPPMYLHAVVVIERATYSVMFRYLDEGECVVDTVPTITIPCRDYDHARAVASAFNTGEHRDA